MPAGKLREWYHHLDLLGVDGEVTIDGSRSLQEVLGDLLERIGPLVCERRDLDPARFL
ncbi:hypothetical protein [Kribbella endophytica]